MNYGYGDMGAKRWQLRVPQSWARQVLDLLVRIKIRPVQFSLVCNSFYNVLQPNLFAMVLKYNTEKG